MALTRNLRRTGRAGAMEKADLRTEVLDLVSAKAEQIKLDFGDLLGELKTLDPEGWSAWYDANVPDWNDWFKCEAVFELIRKRVNELKTV